MSAAGRTEPPGLEDLRAAVRARLSGRRLDHVEGVVRTVAAIADEAGWPAGDRARGERAAWYHDACKGEDVGALVRRIVEAGEELDRWALAHAPGVLHAQAAAVWAADRGETDDEVLAAVRHHPTGRADWGPIGLVLFVADFAEPSRPFAADLRTDRLRRLAGEGPDALTEAARRALALKLSRLLEKNRPVHPEGWRAWNAWHGAGAA